MTDLSINQPATAAAADLSQPLHTGTEAHKQAFCGVLLDTFDPYKPAIIAWPKLSADAQRRLTSLPFWDVAVETEGYASTRMQAMADTIRDPLIKQAVALNAFEEGRHKLVIRNMLKFYGIATKPETNYAPPRNAEWSFLRTGYGECFDSFFAFGLFRLARESGYFPVELVEVFEPIIQEEARHIMFFVNWVAYTAANRPWPLGLWFRAKCLAALGGAALGRLSLATTASDGGKSSDNFVAAGGETLTVDLSVRKLLTIALEEDHRRMSRYDARLKRPQIMPFVARLVLKFIR